MRQLSVRSEESAGSTSLTVLSKPALGAPLLAIWLALAAAPAWAQAAPDPCKGRLVRSLGGAHAVSRVHMDDLADLQKRLPDLEAAMRDVIARDPTVGPGVADALFDAIRAGRVTERKLARNEDLKWMIYQPEKGKFETIAPPCVKLDRDYEAFEVTIEVANPPAPAGAANCALAVTRNCEHTNPTITIDTTGSSANARVERGGQPVSGQGARFSIPDGAPCSKDETFVVRAEGMAPPAQLARVYRFVIPKACSNLAFLGENESRQLAAAGKPVTCEKSVTAAQCAPWAEMSVDPLEVEVHNPATIRTSGGWSDCTSALSAGCEGEAEPITLDPSGSSTFVPSYICCGANGFDLRYETKNAAGKTAEATASLPVRMHDWIFRGSLAYILPMDGEISRDLVSIPGAVAHEEFEVDDGIGVSLALERRFNQKWGLEFGALFGQAETSYELTVGGETGEYDLSPKFYAFTVGPNFHLLGCGSPDLYIGPLIGYGGFYDPNYWVDGHRFHADFSADFLWGAQLGLDVPFDRTSDWAFHGGVRYLVLDQDTDAGSIDIDPLVLEAGIAYKF